MWLVAHDLLTCMGGFLSHEQRKQQVITGWLNENIVMEFCIFLLPYILELLLFIFQSQANVSNERYVYNFLWKWGDVITKLIARWQGAA